MEADSIFSAHEKAVLKPGCHNTTVGLEVNGAGTPPFIPAQLVFVGKSFYQ